MRSGKYLATLVRRIYGTQAAAARALGCSPAAFCVWLQGGPMSNPYRRLCQRLVADDRRKGGPVKRRSAR